MRYSPKKQYDLDELLQKADNGDLDAMGTAACLLTAEYDNEDPAIEERIVRYLQALVEAEKGFACIMLADHYLTGRVVPQSVSRAISLYKKAVSLGCLFGNDSIGYLYFSGNYVPVDYKKALRYFKKGEKKKAPVTLYALGEMYRLGLAVRKSDKKALRFYRQVIDSVNRIGGYDDYYWRACYREACASHYGRGTKGDLLLACFLLERARDHFKIDPDDPFPIRKQEFKTEMEAVYHELGIEDDWFDIEDEEEDEEE